MNKFMYDGQEIEIPKVKILSHEEFQIDEGQYKGEIFSVKNIQLEGETLSFDCDSIPEIQNIVCNYMRYVLTNAAEEYSKQV